MSNEIKFPGRSDAPDEQFGQLIRPLYEAPQESTYWDGLHTRIMNRVLSAAPDDVVEWWMVMSRWARMGTVAAAVLAVLAGALLMQYEQREARMAYDAVLSQPPTYSFQMDGPEDEPPPPTNPILRSGLP